MGAAWERHEMCESALREHRNQLRDGAASQDANDGTSGEYQQQPEHQAGKRIRHAQEQKACYKSFVYVVCLLQRLKSFELVPGAKMTISPFQISVNKDPDPMYLEVLTAVAQWLRYCATNRKVAGSIPDGVIGIFH